MKQTGICPKCTSLEIYKKTSTNDPRSAISLSTLNYFVIDLHICLDCGYIEEYISEKDLLDKKKIEKVLTKWDRGI
ncbi:hypothetical protein ACE193_18740 [Bernardetia sp. OM2101]|uniref:hypothetical protein n=1 Tax=Bernardetia sp. OM2101 TaxID=3344876 RepID=UPI0035CF6977